MKSLKAFFASFILIITIISATNLGEISTLACSTSMVISSDRTIFDSRNIDQVAGKTVILSSSKPAIISMFEDNVCVWSSDWSDCTITSTPTPFFVGSNVTEIKIRLYNPDDNAATLRAVAVDAACASVVNDCDLYLSTAGIVSGKLSADTKVFISNIININNDVYGYIPELGKYVKISENGSKYNLKFDDLDLIRESYSFSQTDGKWSQLGYSTKDEWSKYGCLVTAFSINIANSGKVVVKRDARNISEGFNPASYAKEMHKVKALDRYSCDPMYVSSWTGMISNTKAIAGRKFVNVSDSSFKKASTGGWTYLPYNYSKSTGYDLSVASNKIEEFLDKGYLLIYEGPGSGSGSHYVAVTDAYNGQVFVTDPSDGKTKNIVDKFGAKGLDKKTKYKSHISLYMFKPEA